MQVVALPASYYRARYYDPSVGRFLSEDPKRFAAGSDFYRYAKNNSANLVDPYGLNTDVLSLPWWWWLLVNPIEIPFITVGPGGAAIIIGLGELTLAPSAGIDDARAIPKANPDCNKGKDKDACWNRYLEEKAFCSRYWGTRLYGMCRSRALARYEACRDKLPDPGPLDPLEWPDAPANKE